MTEEKIEVKATEDNVQVQNEPVKSEAPVVETDQERNWKKFREQREKERLNAEELQRKAQQKEAEAQALQAALEAILNKPGEAKQHSSEEEEESEEKRFEKRYYELRKREKEQEEIERAKNEQKSLPIKIREMHSDFDQVCSANNLDYLEFHHPELSRSLSKRSDSIEKWTDIYNAVKRYIPNTNILKEQVKATNNLNRPQGNTSSTMSTGEKSHAIVLDEDRKRANWERMQKTLKSF